MYARAGSWPHDWTCSTIADGRVGSRAQCLCTICLRLFVHSLLVLVASAVSLSRWPWPVAKCMAAADHAAEQRKWHETMANMRRVVGVSSKQS